MEDYQGPRTASGIIDAVKLAIPNHVKKITDKGLNAWLESSNGTTKAILFSEKGTTGALIKVLSIEFLASIKFAQIRSKETAAVEMFGVNDFPSLIILPGGSQEPVKFDGAFSKSALKEFLARFAEPKVEPEPEPKKQKPLAKKPKKKENSKAKTEETKTEELKPEEPKPEEEAKPEEPKADGVKPEETHSEKAKSTSEPSSFASAPASHASVEAAEMEAEEITITLGGSSSPTESPEPIAVPEDAPKPVPIPEPFPPIPALLEENHLQKQCLDAKATTCVLALLPAATDDEGSTLPETANVALASLAELADKHVQRGSKLFPFYTIPNRNAAATKLREALKLGDDREIVLIAVNARRGWWRQYKNVDYRFNSVENWVDNIRFGEGEKGKLPEELIFVEEEIKAQAPPEHGEL